MIRSLGIGDRGAAADWSFGKCDTEYQDVRPSKHPGPRLFHVREGLEGSLDSDLSRHPS
jgi:hypothetical protein